MIPGITNELLARLIRIGRQEAFDELQQFLADFPEARSGHFMRQPFQEWYEIARRYSREDVMALIKVLTVAERDLPAFCGGSVSPVISLYRYLLDTTQDDFTELRDWVVAHTQNQYLPFGSGRYRPASISEYHHQLAEHEARRREREQVKEAALIARRVAREKRRLEQHQDRLRRRQSRDALIASLQHISPVERLGHVIADTAHRVTFYPVEWAVLDSATIQSLPVRLRAEAIQRLADRRTGLWRKLREQLERIAEPNAAPNGGHATQLGNSGVTEGPPSVS